MKIIGTTFEKLPRERLVIGFEGENLRATVRIDCASVFAEYPNATPALIVKPLFADAYPVVVERSGTYVDWLITSEILSFTGDGEIQLVFYKDQVICKSAVSKIRVSRSLMVNGEMPDPVAQWIDDANAKLAEVDAQIVELEEMVDTATDAATRAEQSASTASAKAEQAAGSAATATAKATEATTAATTATAKAAEAEQSALTATKKATAAAESERIATAKAGEATTAAGTATAKAEQATEAAQTATEKAGDASASARAAQESATDAASSATAAQSSQTAAKASETAAGASATQAAQSAQTANTASQTATQKAAEATQSATDAETFAGTATTKAEEAAASAQAAASARDTAQTTVAGAIAGIQAEGQTQVSNVNTAGGTQVSAVQAKGTEVLNSIPADYTELSDDVSDLKSAISYKTEQDSMSYAIKSAELEIGRLDDSGEPVYHAQRCRTKDYIRVNSGDIITTIDLTMDTTKSCMVFFYDTDRIYVSKTGWLYFSNSNTQRLNVQADGFIKVLYGTADYNLYNDKVVISRTANQNTAQIQALESKLRTTILPIPSVNLIHGYWVASSAEIVYRNSSYRARTINPLKVSKGDELHFTHKNEYLMNFTFQTESQETIITNSNRTNMPHKAPSDGYFYLTLFTPTDDTEIDLASYDNAITIKRQVDIGDVEDIRSVDLYNGYITAGDSIANHAKRLVNWNPIHANKGDIIRMNRTDVMMHVVEYNDSKVRLAQTSQYITAEYVGGNYPDCGDYYVQNDDCWVMCTFATIGIEDPSTFLPIDYDRIASVIHINATDIRNADTSTDTLFRFPKSARKSKKLSTDAVVHQGATFVRGKLWACNEISGGTDYIQVINPDTGVIERTITHNLGHCNCLDYDEETDTLMTVDSLNYNTILLCQNVSDIINSIDKANCISIPVDGIDFFGTCCFGQDSREVYIYCGAGSETPYNLYKGVLGYDSNGYTGTFEVVKLYSGVIRHNVDAYIMTGFGAYAQDSCYDGYFYLAYGSSGHNFLVIDLDDRENTYRVVGNYLHHEYKDDRTEYGVEPEGVALHDGKIYCLSRQNTIHASYFNIFDR